MTGKSSLKQVPVGARLGQRWKSECRHRHRTDRGNFLGSHTRSEDGACVLLVHSHLFLFLVCPLQLPADRRTNPGYSGMGPHPLMPHV